MATLTSPLRRIGAVLVFATCSTAAFAQPACTVAQEMKLATVTGRFSLGPSTLALTLPYTLFRSDPSVVYMQVSGADFPKELLLGSGGEKAPIQDGAPLHLSPKRNQRLTFSITDTDGRSLCEWAAGVGTSKFDPPAIPEGFGPRSDLSFQRTIPRITTRIQGFRNAGDPILLQVGGELASETARFSIDGLPAIVLSRNAGQVILQDPHPAAGMRTIQSRGYAISIPVIVLEMKLLNSTAPGPTSIEVNILGRDRIDLPPLPTRHLSLTNFDPGALEVLCDKPPHGLGASFIRLNGKDDRLTGSCRVKLLKPGAVRMDAMLTENLSRMTLRLPWP